MAALALACIACDAPSEAKNLTVSVTGSSSISRPGEVLIFTANVVPADGVAVREIVMTASGMLTVSDTFRVDAPGPQRVSRSYLLPQRITPGDFVLDVYARGTGGAQGSSRIVLVARDELPPEVEVSPLGADSVIEPGDSLHLRISARDNYGLSRVVLTTGGAVTRVDTVVLTTAQAEVSLDVPVPDTTPLGARITLSASAVDVAGQVTTAAPLQAAVADLHDPAIAAAFPAAAPYYYTVGGTLRFSVEASDNLGVTWIGYTLHGAADRQDSVAVSGRSASHEFAIPLPSGWAGASALRVFARDGGGRRAGAALGGVVVGATARPLALASYDLPGWALAVAFDTKRGNVLLSHPSLNRVSVFSLSRRTFGTPIALAAPPGPIDVGPGGDTLVVALDSVATIAVADLSAAAVTAATVSLATGGDFRSNEVPVDVVVLAGGKAMIRTYSAGFSSAALYEYDLTTRQPRFVPGGSDGGSELQRSYDGSRMLMVGYEMKVYAAESGAFVASRGEDYFGYYNVMYPLGADQDGARFLLRQFLVDGQLGILRPLRANGFNPGDDAGALAPGGYAALAADGALRLVRVADGTVVRNIALPFTPQTVDIAPDGGTIVVTYRERMIVITLF